jgi:hypothetical protein
VTQQAVERALGKLLTDENFRERLSQAAAMRAVQLGGFLLAFLLSGLIFPVENIPAGLRWISNLVQARYYIVIVRDALLPGAAGRRCGRRFRPSAPSAWSSTRSHGARPGACR